MKTSQKPQTLSVYEFLRACPNDEEASKYLEKRRWANGRFCPHCGSVRTVVVKSKKPMPYRCQDCRQHFSIRTGTILAESKIPLHKWLFAELLSRVVYAGLTRRPALPGGRP